MCGSYKTSRVGPQVAATAAGAAARKRPNHPCIGNSCNLPAFSTQPCQAACWLWRDCSNGVYAECMGASKHPVHLLDDHWLHRTLAAPTTYN